MIGRSPDGPKLWKAIRFDRICKISIGAARDNDVPMHILQAMTSNDGLEDYFAYQETESVTLSLVGIVDLEMSRYVASYFDQHLAGMIPRRLTFFDFR